MDGFLSFIGLRKPSKTETYFKYLRQDDLRSISKMLKKDSFMAEPILYNRVLCYPFHVACAMGSQSVVKLFLRFGADVELSTSRGYTPLHFAAGFNKPHPEVTQLLVDNGALIDAQEGQLGYTPLHWAVQNNNVGAAKVLLRSAGQELIKDNKGNTAKDLANILDNKPIITLLESIEMQVSTANLANLECGKRRFYDSGNYSTDEVRHSIKSLTEVFGSSFTLQADNGRVSMYFGENCKNIPFADESPFQIQLRENLSYLETHVRRIDDILTGLYQQKVINSKEMKSMKQGTCITDEQKVHCLVLDHLIKTKDGFDKFLELLVNTDQGDIADIIRNHEINRTS